MMDTKGDDTEALVCSGQALWGYRIERFQAGTLGQVPQHGQLSETTPPPPGLPCLKSTYRCTLSPPGTQILKAPLLKGLLGQVDHSLLTLEFLRTSSLAHCLSSLD